MDRMDVIGDIEIVILNRWPFIKINFKVNKGCFLFDFFRPLFVPFGQFFIGVRKKFPFVAVGFEKNKNYMREAFK